MKITTSIDTAFMLLNIYIYIYMCVCVCVVRGGRHDHDAARPSVSASRRRDMSTDPHVEIVPYSSLTLPKDPKTLCGTI